MPHYALLRGTVRVVHDRSAHWRAGVDVNYPGLPQDVNVGATVLLDSEPTEVRRMNEVIELKEPKAKMLRSAAVLAQELENSGIVVFTRSGFLAYTLAGLRTVGVPIYAFTDDEALFRQLLLPWGVEPFLMPPASGGRLGQPNFGSGSVSNPRFQKRGLR